MSDDGFAPGPIAWAPLDELFEPSPGGVFEDVLARAMLDAPDLERAIDTARVDATPIDAADIDAGDDQDLVDGAAELAGAAARVRELRPIDELAALTGLDPEIETGAQEFPPEPEDAPLTPWEVRERPDRNERGEPK